jgi:hypothetical protein
MKKSNHFPISEAEAIELFQPQNLKLPETNKISKTVINKTRWQSRDANAPLVVSVNGKYHDLLWLNGTHWTYICTRIP